MIRYGFDSTGGFMVGDEATGVTSYAYVTSDSADAAKKDPQRTAWSMVYRERQLSGYRHGNGHLAIYIRRRDAERLAWLRDNGESVSCANLPLALDAEG